MNRYMPITGIDNNFPSLLIDTQAPVDVLHDTAAYRSDARQGFEDLSAHVLFRNRMAKLPCSSIRLSPWSRHNFCVNLMRGAACEAPAAGSQCYGNASRHRLQGETLCRIYDALDRRGVWFR